jgi:hypothetical protein
VTTLIDNSFGVEGKNFDTGNLDSQQVRLCVKVDVFSKNKLALLIFYIKVVSSSTKIFRLYSTSRTDYKADRTQVDQNGIVCDWETDRKCDKNGTFTGIYRVNTPHFRSVSIGIRGRSITDRIVSVS